MPYNSYYCFIIFSFPQHQAKTNKHTAENNRLQEFFGLPNGSAPIEPTSTQTDSSINSPGTSPVHPSKKQKTSTTLSGSQDNDSDRDRNIPSDSLNKQPIPYDRLLTLLDGMNNKLTSLQQDMTVMKDKQLQTDSQLEGLRRTLDSRKSRQPVSPFVLDWVMNHSKFVAY